MQADYHKCLGISKLSFCILGKNFVNCKINFNRVKKDFADPFTCETVYKNMIGAPKCKIILGAF